MKVVLNVFSLLVAFCTFGQADTLFVKDLSAGWLTFDAQGSTIPYQKDDSDIVFFELPATADAGSYLLIACEERFDLWINDQLVQERFEGRRSLRLDSLLNAYVSTPTITLYGQDWRASQLKTNIYKISPSQSKNRYTRIKPNGYIGSDIYLIFSLLIIVVIGIYRKYFPSSFSKAVRNPFRVKLRGLGAEDNYQGFASLDNIFSMAVLGILSALLISYMGYWPVKSGYEDTWYMALWSMLVLSGLVVAYLGAKYMLSFAVARIFDFRSVPNIQAQDHIHMLILVILGCLFLSAFDFTIYNFSSDQAKWLIIFLLIVFFIFFQIWLVVKLDKFYSHRKLMIIAYLCTTEFLPGFLIIYWLVKS